MIFAWISHRSTNDDSICVSAQCCAYSFCSLVFLAAGIPCLPPTLLTPGLCDGISLKQQLGWAFSPQCMEYRSPRVSIPGTKGKSCPLLPLLSPCPGSYCCPSLAALPRSGSSSLRANPHRALLFLPPFTAVSPCP